MKLYNWIFLVILLLGFSSCKDDEYFYSNNEQDRDNDEITGDDYIYHIPVIFHVIYQDQNAIDKDGNKSQYIPYTRLKAILDNVNDLYSGKIYNFGGENSENSENIHVQFELALCDEFGKKLSTPGVEYIKYSGSYPIDCNQFMNQKKGKNKYIWDPNEYINVMVYNFKTEDESATTTLGISNMPFKAGGYPDIEGLSDAKRANMSKDQLSFEYCVSINSLYINQESSFFTDPKHGKDGFTYYPSDVNITLAHELGHYLGLHHVFAEEESDKGSVPANNCNDTDFCEDTKSYNKVAYSKWLEDFWKEHQDKTDVKLKDLIKRSNDQGDEWDSDNLMDYAYSLSYRFTPDQAYRMRQVLYYSPLMPGPKKNRSTTDTRSSDNDEPIDLPIRLAVRQVASGSTPFYVKNNY